MARGLHVSRGLRVGRTRHSFWRARRAVSSLKKPPSFALASLRKAVRWFRVTTELLFRILLVIDKNVTEMKTRQRKKMVVRSDQSSPRASRLKLRRRRLTE